MQKLIAVLAAAVFASITISPLVFAQDQKKEQVHKGTPEAGTVQKKAQKKTQKKDGSGAKKNGTAKKSGGTTKSSSGAPKDDATKQ